MLANILTFVTRRHTSRDETRRSAKLDTTNENISYASRSNWNQKAREARRIPSKREWTVCSRNVRQRAVECVRGCWRVTDGCKRDRAESVKISTSINKAESSFRITLRDRGELRVRVSYYSLLCTTVFRTLLLPPRWEQTYCAQLNEKWRNLCCTDR